MWIRLEDRLININNTKQFSIREEKEEFCVLMDDSPIARCCERASAISIVDELQKLVAKHCIVVQARKDS